MNYIEIAADDREALIKMSKKVVNNKVKRDHYSMGYFYFKKVS